MAKQTQDNCSFCGRSKEEAGLLISGITGHICDLCVEQGYNILQEEKQKTAKTKFNDIRLIKPMEIKAHLDEYVIGQDNAKKVLSVAVYNHYKRIKHQSNLNKDEIEIDKSNIIFAGPTGTGKTLMARTIAKLLDVPFCIADATVLTEAGYVGEDVESVLVRLLQVADYNIPAVERGIVFIDEIDKISRKSDNPSITRDVSGEGVQQALLKLLEGSIINVPPQGGRKHPEQRMLQLNTQNILFICGGAFEGIERIIANRVGSTTIGYTHGNSKKVIDKNNYLQYIAPQDLKTFGLIPEIVGRLPVLTHFTQLDRDALRNILVQPKNSILKQFQKLFSIDDIELVMDDDALDYIVDKALEYKLGARGLRSLFEAIMNDDMFSMPSNEKLKKLHITRKYAEGKLEKANLSFLKVA